MSTLQKLGEGIAEIADKLTREISYSTSGKDKLLELIATSQIKQLNVLDEFRKHIINRDKALTDAIEEEFASRSEAISSVIEFTNPVSPSA